jgi:hypothetical protein
MVLGIILLALSLLSSSQLRSQVASFTLSGNITGPSGAPIPNAKISVKNVATGQSAETHTDPLGLYNLPNLVPGDYELSVSADGFTTNVTRLTITSEAKQTMDLKLAKALSLGDLGFPVGQAQGSDVNQAALDKRTHMLKVHQELGLITTAPLVATCITGAFAGGRTTSSTSRDVHLALGSLTVAMYFPTAYYAIFAPKIHGTPTRGPIRVHKLMAYIHVPGMILTPILGAMAYDEKLHGEKVHGIASAHGAVAIITAAAYGAAILSVTLKF